VTDHRFVKKIHNEMQCVVVVGWCLVVCVHGLSQCLHTATRHFSNMCWDDESMDAFTHANVKPASLLKFFDFASGAAGARVINASKAVQGAGNILGDNPDRYLMTPCKNKPKWVVIQLSEDIKLEEIGFENFEHYSSGFKDIQVLGSEKYPTKSWILLGDFVLQDSRETQFFSTTDPAWVRFLKLRFLSYHRDHHFCTLTGVHAYGTRVIEDLEKGIVKLETEADAEHVAQTPNLSQVDQFNGLENEDEKVSSSFTIDEDVKTPVKGQSVFERLANRLAILESKQKQTRTLVDTQLKHLRAAFNRSLSEIERAVSSHGEFLFERFENMISISEESSQDARIAMTLMSQLTRHVETIQQDLDFLELLVVGLICGFFMQFLFVVVLVSLRFKTSKISVKSPGRGPLIDVRDLKDGLEIVRKELFHNSGSEDDDSKEALLATPVSLRRVGSQDFVSSIKTAFTPSKSKKKKFRKTLSESANK